MSEKSIPLVPLQELVSRMDDSAHPSIRKMIEKLDPTHLMLLEPLPMDTSAGNAVLAIGGRDCTFRTIEDVDPTKEIGDLPSQRRKPVAYASVEGYDAVLKRWKDPRILDEVVKAQLRAHFAGGDFGSLTDARVRQELAGLLATLGPHLPGHELGRLVFGLSGNCLTAFPAIRALRDSEEFWIPGERSGLLHRYYWQRPGVELDYYLGGYNTSSPNPYWSLRAWNAPNSRVDDEDHRHKKRLPFFFEPLKA